MSRYRCVLMLVLAVFRVRSLFKMRVSHHNVQYNRLQGPAELNLLDHFEAHLPVDLGIDIIAAF